MDGLCLSQDNTLTPTNPSLSLHTAGVKTATNYADRNYLMRDLKNARDLARDKGYTEIDVTGRAVEETASLISELLTQKLAAKNIEFEGWVEEMGGDVDALATSAKSEGKD